MKKIVNHKKIYKFTRKYFLVGHVIFVLIIKNNIKNENSILHQIYAGYEK